MESVVTVWKNTYFIKTVIVTPLFKGGSRGEAKKYRPVALTSHIIKNIEKIVVKKLTAFLETNQLLNPTQHGFRAHRYVSHNCYHTMN